MSNGDSGRHQKLIVNAVSHTEMCENHSKFGYNDEVQGVAADSVKIVLRIIIILGAVFFFFFLNG